MAVDVIERAISVGDLKAVKASQTADLVLVGGRNFNSDFTKRLKEDFQLEDDIAVHLASTYGDQASELLAIAKQGFSKRLSSKHPFIEAEVVYAFQAEAARTPIDVVARRIRLSFLDKEAAIEALPRVVEILGDLQGWKPERRSDELKKALASL